MENNWTKKYLLIIWTITLIVVLISLGYQFLAGFGEHFGLTASRWSNVTETECDFTGKTVSSAEINMNAADLDIRYGDTFTVKYKIEDRYAPKVELKNGKLSINQNIKKFYMKSRSEDYEVYVVIPRDTVLDTLDVNLDAGDIGIMEVRGKDFDIEVDAGNLKFTGVQADSTSISADAGDIGIQDSFLGNLSIEADMGNIDLNDVDFTNGTIEADMGNVEVNGRFDKLYANCDLGNIEIITPDLDAVDLQLECDLGKKTVNGQEW